MYKSKFNLASLPPTKAAARQHSFRTYHQVQQWYGAKKNPEVWGWKKNKNGLTPITTLKEPAPKKLLKLISCKCKKGCQSACGCRKAGLKCSIVCIYCNGSCQNVQEILYDSDNEEETDTFLQEVLSFSEDFSSENEKELHSDEESIPVDISVPGPSGTKQRKLY